MFGLVNLSWLESLVWEATIRISGGTHGSFFKRSLLIDAAVAEATQRLVTTLHPF